MKGDLPPERFSHLQDELQCSGIYIDLERILKLGKLTTWIPINQTLSGDDLWFVVRRMNLAEDFALFKAVGLVRDACSAMSASVKTSIRVLLTEQEGTLWNVHPCLADTLSLRHRNMETWHTFHFRSLSKRHFTRLVIASTNGSSCTLCLKACIKGNLHDISNQ